MDFNLVQIREQAERKEEENSRFRLFLKHKCNLEPEEIDARVFAATRRVWAGIDCTKCANCCREVKRGFSDEEVDRLARRLSMTRERFIETYLERSEADCSSNYSKTKTSGQSARIQHSCGAEGGRSGDACDSGPHRLWLAQPFSL